MPFRDVVGVAGSAGGVEALKRLVAGLPDDLPATVLVALHLPRTARSMLPQILQRTTGLRVVAAEEHMPLEPRTVVVAQPDTHLLLLEDHLVLGRGATENGHRPSHDAMLRSLALAHGPRAVGVVLTGLLNDGTAGLAAVQRYGGLCFVQDPDDAEFPSMPRHALEAVPQARSAPLARLADEVTRAVTEDHLPRPDVDPVQRELDRVELQSALGELPVMPDGLPPGTPSPFSCPDCRGVLNHIPDQVTRFRCRTGHAWTGEALLDQQGAEIEEALWVALRVLQERGDMSRRLADEAGLGHRSMSRDMFSARAREADRSAEALRTLLHQQVSREAHPEGESAPAT